MGDWIDVDARLPLNDDYVLVYMQNGAVFSSQKTHCCKYTKKYGFDRSRVTHWMPIPEPPKQPEPQLNAVYEG